MVRAVGFDRDTKRYRVGVMAGGLELIVIQLDDVGALLGKQRGHLTNWPGVSGSSTSKFMMRPRAIIPF